MRRKNHDLNAIENDSIKFSIHTPPVSQERVTSQEVPHPKQTGSTKQGTVSLRDTLPSSQFSGMQDIEFLAIATNARHIMPGDLAVYQIGKQDPAQLVSDAMARGAAGILTEQLLPCPLPQCIVGDMELALASLHSALLDRPDQKLLTMGVVGSAGKTTTALLISHLLRQHEIRTAYQTDLGSSDGVVSQTPSQSVSSAGGLVNWLGEAVDCEAQVAVIEVLQDDARHGRYDAIEFDIVVVTGTSSSTDDFGPTATTCVLENLHPEGVVVYPADDARTSRIVCDAGVHSLSYGVLGAADLTAKIIDQAGGVSTLLLSHEDTTAAMETHLAGGAMAANHAAAAAVGLLIDLPLAEIAEQLGALKTVPGRGQRFESLGHASVIVDVAGSASRCEAALRTARSMKNGGRLWCIATMSDLVAQESQLMRLGSLLERFADQVVVTTTPDRKHKFLKSSHDVLDGVQECAAMRLVADSRRALQWAMQEARPTDTILLLTNQSFASAQEERVELAAIESTIQSNRNVLDAGENRPKLKVFGSS